MDPQQNSDSNKQATETGKISQNSQYCNNNIKIIYNEQRLAGLVKKSKYDKMLSIMCRLSTDGGVWITNGAWKELGFNGLFDYQYQQKTQQYIVYQWGIYSALGLIYNLQPKILQHISTINFPYLLFLCLDSNNIQTIQPLTRTRLDCLIVLTLNDNKITSIRQFKRSNWPQLQVLEIYNNYISQYFGNNLLQEAFWPELKKLAFGIKNPPRDYNTKAINTDIRHHPIGNLCKLQTNKLQNISKFSIY